MATLKGTTNQPNEVGVLGESGKFEGVRGVSHAGYHGGVVGVNDNAGDAAGPGVYGESRGTGVWGVSKTWIGVYGKSESGTGGVGVMGESAGTGVIGKSSSWHGVYGESHSTSGGAGVYGEGKAGGTGVSGKSETGIGVWAVSETYEGLRAETKSADTAALAAYQLNPGSDRPAIYARHLGGRNAAFFDGSVFVTGDVLLQNADCAEDFAIADGAAAEPGMVMVIDETGSLAESRLPYDKRVAGVLSGAGDYKPGLILDRQAEPAARRPLALLGKVFCRVDAGSAGIEVGDLLTTSETPGHAMKATDAARAFGAVLGKALRPLASGRGLIPVLVALQ